LHEQPLRLLYIRKQLRTSSQFCGIDRMRPSASIARNTKLFFKSVAAMARSVHKDHPSACEYEYPPLWTFAEFCLTVLERWPDKLLQFVGRLAQQTFRSQA
jgi:hypothetical protein